MAREKGNGKLGATVGHIEIQKENAQVISYDYRANNLGVTVKSHLLVVQIEYVVTRSNKCNMDYYIPL